MDELTEYWRWAEYVGPGACGFVDMMEGMCRRSCLVASVFPEEGSLAESVNGGK